MLKLHIIHVFICKLHFRKFCFIQHSYLEFISSGKINLITQGFRWCCRKVDLTLNLIYVRADLFLIISLTHWGRVTHICVSNLTIIGSDNGLSPGRRQAIIWTNAGILLIGPLGANFSEILIEIQTFSFIKMRLKVSSAKWRPFCLGHNVLIWIHKIPMPVKQGKE